MLVFGGYAHNVAEMLRTSVSQVHRVVYPRICEKMSVARIDEARKLAITYRLIELRQGGGDFSKVRRSGDHYLLWRPVHRHS